VHQHISFESEQFDDGIGDTSVPVLDVPSTV